MLSISSTCFALYARSYILLYDSFNPTSECETFVVESTEVARKITAARGEVCAAPPDSTNDTNNNDNNSGIDFNQQYREWKEMMVAATGARERAEEEKQVKKKNTGQTGLTSHPTTIYRVEFLCLSPLFSLSTFDSIHESEDNRYPQ